MITTRTLIFSSLFASALCGLSTAQAFTPGGKPELPQPIVVRSNAPQSCYVVFQTKAGAQAHCPRGVQAIEAHDVWSGNFLGWSCDCEHKSGPQHHASNNETEA